MQRTLYFIVSLILCPGLALADGGTLRFSQRCGEFQVSVFTSPAVLRAGQVDVSVLVQDADTGKTRNDIPILVRLSLVDQAGLEIEHAATTTDATNKLFRAALFDVPRPGIWQASVFLGQGASQEPAPLTFDLNVAPPPPAWLQLAPWIGWPAALVALFFWHQRLAVRREAGNAAARKPGATPSYLSLGTSR
jgi:hypothetical protein